MSKHCNTCGVSKDENCFGVNRASADGRYFQCKSCRSDYLKTLYVKYPEKFKARTLLWEATDAGAKKTKDARSNRYYNNKAHVSEVNSAWKAANPDRLAEYGAKYRTKKRTATPPWLTAEHWAKISVMYGLSRRLTETTGVQMSVDHIVPLNGKAVSGLHVPWNLQVIQLSENFAKGNKYVNSQ